MTSNAPRTVEEYLRAEVVRALGGFDPDSALGRGGINIEPEWLNSPIGLALCCIVGILLLTLTLHLGRAVTRGHAAFAKAMLVLP